MLRKTTYVEAAQFFNFTEKTNDMAKQNDPLPNKLHQPAHDPAANRENQDLEFPGYPHHPAKEDVLNPINDLNDVLPSAYQATTAAVADPEAEVTEEDLALLGDPNLDQDGGDDELMDNYQGLDDTDLDGDPLNEYAGTMSATGSDLDMPDEELDNAGTTMEPTEDEENDYFSLGADKDSLEDDQAGKDF